MEMCIIRISMSFYIQSVAHAAWCEGGGGALCTGVLAKMWLATAAAVYMRTKAAATRGTTEAV